jgi:hypothetical protein
MTKTLTKNQIQDVMASWENFMGVWETKQKEKQNLFQEEMKKHKHLFTEMGFVAHCDWDGAGDDGDIYKITLTQNGEEVRNKVVEKIVENLSYDYLNAFHPGCEISDGEVDGSYGTITIDDDGISDDLQQRVCNEEDISSSVSW